MMGRIAILLTTGALLSCNRSGNQLVVESDHPSVFDIGRLEVIEADAWLTNPNAAVDVEAGLGYHGTIGPAESGLVGGSTFNFLGTGGQVCVFVDPETVFWGNALGQDLSQIAENYVYPDNYRDDGDIDLFVGLSAFYTGSPGVEMGDFQGNYTDSNGQTIQIEYNECFQVGYQDDMAHAGRATPEYCTIDTDQREGVEFTVVLETFNVPIDDGGLDFVAGVVASDCASLLINECSYVGETLQRDMDDKTYEISVVGLENAFCNIDGLNEYCCEYDEEYDICGAPPDPSYCASLLGDTGN